MSVLPASSFRLCCVLTALHQVLRYRRCRSRSPELGTTFQLLTVNLRFLPVAVAALLLIVPATFAQTSATGIALQERPRAGVAAYYYYAEPGDLTINVNVWGTVRYPGRYEVQTGTNLGELLSYAGGPLMQSRQEHDQRQVTIRISRPTEEGREIIYKAELDSMIVSSAKYPVMQHGDIVTIETVEMQGITWRDVLGVVGAAASVGVLILRFLEFKP